MKPQYHNFGNDHDEDDDDDDDDDDDIGALGSILSWDEDEDGGVVGAGHPGSSAMSDRESMHSSTLPDLVSFNMKDGGLSTLQQLQGSSGNDGTNLSIPMPTPINFGQTQVLNQSSQGSIPQHKQDQTQGNKAAGDTGAGQTSQQQHIPQQQVSQQQQLSQQLSQQQQQQQISHQQQQQQMSQQQQQQQQMSQQQQQLLVPPGSTQQTQVQHPQQQNQQNVGTPSVQPQSQIPNQTAMASNLAQHGAFALFQQGALLAQPQNATIPAMMMSNVTQGSTQDQRADQQAAAQFAFAADPNAFLRQLQVAQLQQQLNAAQQAGRPLAQQVVGAATQANQVSAALQQQMQFQAQVPMVPPAAVPPVQPGAASAPKKGRDSAPKKAPPTSAAEGSKTESARGSKKAPVVSASDTDGEVSSKLSSTAFKSAKKASQAEIMARKKSAEIDMSNMTPAEKAKANRDRNREHARNTRLRKKAYLEKLKSTVDELCRERDTLVSERAGAANILVDMHNTRTEVLMSFFALRSANEKRRELWSSILDESCFACVMPVTPYRSFPASEVQVSKCQRTILGIDGMMSDTSSLHVLLNSLVDRSRYPNGTIVFRYTLVTEEAVVAGNQMMARWVMTTLNATQCGARMEVAKQGMLCCKFNSAHKIIGLELMFDVMALMLQLKQAAGSDTFSVIPNTVQTCQRSFDKPMVMTLAEEPYTIVQVNKLWEDMTGYKAEDVVGKTSCRILEGEKTDPSAVEGMMNEVRFKRPASIMIMHYKKTGERFHNFFLAYPLSTDSRITHYLSLTTHVGNELPGQDGTMAATQQGILPLPEKNPSSSKAAETQMGSGTSSQSSYFNSVQNLQNSMAKAHSSLANPQSQGMFGLAPVQSSSIPSAPLQNTMLPPNLAPVAAQQQFQASTLKRAPSGDPGRGSAKQAKTGA